MITFSLEDLLLLLPGNEGQIPLILAETGLIQSYALIFVRNGIFLIHPYF